MGPSVPSNQIYCVFLRMRPLAGGFYEMVLFKHLILGSFSLVSTL